MKMTAIWMLTAVLAITWCGVAAVEGASLADEIVVSQEDNEAYQPAIAYDFERQLYLMVWHQVGAGAREIVGALLDRSGAVINVFPIAGGDDDRVQPAVAYDPTNDRYLVTFSHDVFGDGSDWDLGGRLVPWGGPDPAYPQFPICVSSSTQLGSELAFAGTQQEFMAVWVNLPPTGPAWVSGQRINLDGSLAGGEIVIAAGASPYLNPDLAYNHARNEYLVVYEGQGTDTDILARRVTASGTLLGSEIAVADWIDVEERPAVAASRIDDQYLVAWHSWRGVGDTEVYARFVTGGGTVDGAPLHLFDSGGLEGNPDVGCVGQEGHFLVAFEAEWSGGELGILAVPVRPDHSTDPTLGVRTLYMGETTSCSSPVVVGGSHSWFVGWEHRRDQTSWIDIHGRVVWSMFSDGFESGDLTAWSSVAP